MGTEAWDTRHPHPAILRHREERARSVQNRIADTITRHAGSMRFVYAHIALFAAWMLWLEERPWPTLTLVVSLEAIFLSTFVMISQNRTDEKRAVLASAAWEAVQREEEQNEQLLEISREILDLTHSIHRSAIVEDPAVGAPARGGAGRPRPDRAR